MPIDQRSSPSRSPARRPRSRVSIAIVTPAAASSRTGNRHTAARYARFLRAAGYRVTILTSLDTQRFDLVIALHAKKSRPSMLAARDLDRAVPILLVLTGTDLYRDIAIDRDARRSLAEATRMIVLQAGGLAELTATERAKTDVVVQSAQTAARRAPVVSRFRVIVIGHLRDEKDPFCAVQALAHLPAHDRLEVVQVGDALTPEMAEQARAWMAREPRYRWIGGKSHAATMRWLASSHLMVISSKMEGGANVICEAGRLGVPVLASRVSGNVGMLGRDYPGYYRLGASPALAKLLAKSMDDRAFYRRLERGVRARRPLFAPAAEARGVVAAVRATLASALKSAHKAA